MSDEEEAPSLLLTGSPESDDSNLLLIGGLAALGVGLLWWNKKKKEEEEGGSKKKRVSKKKALPEAKENEVVFASDFTAYEVGEQWFSQTLDPHLEEMVENTSLVTPEWKTKGPLGRVITDEALQKMMDDSRRKVLSAFYIDHFVSVGNTQKTIAAMPITDAVQHFRSLVDSHTQRFQENY